MHFSEGLTKQKMLPVRGICAILIVIFHLSGKIPFVMNSEILQYIVYQFYFIPVAAFFFLSGYGLCTQYRLRGEVYIDSFLRNRMIPLYAKYLSFVAITVLIKSFTRGGVDWLLVGKLCCLAIRS